MKRVLFAWVCACVFLACVASPPSRPPAAFDPAVAWDEFESTLREAYAYLDRADFDVDAHLRRARAAALLTHDAPSLQKVLSAATLAFTDPHLLVGPLDDGAPNVWPTSGDLAVAASAAGYVVADVRAKSPADNLRVRPDFTVLAIDGETIDAAVARLLWLVPQPTTKQRAYAATLAVNGRRDGRARRLTFGTPSGEQALTLENPRAFARAQDELPPLTLSIEGKVATVRFHNSLGRRETIAAFDDAIARAAGADTVILDLRNTPSGGNTDVARAIIGHFISETQAYQIHEIPAVARKTTVPRRFIEQVLPRAPRFTGRVAVVGGRWTGSMGEGLVIGLHAAALARTFASDMGDLLGALHVLDLPATGFKLELGAESLFHIDGTPRADYIADVPLRSADRDPGGGDPALRAISSWLTPRR